MVPRSNLGGVESSATKGKSVAPAALQAKEAPHKTRVRARVGRRQRRPLILRRPGTVGLILFAVAALGVLAIGLLAAALTIFAPVHPAGRNRAAASTPTPASSGLVGRPIDGTLVAVSVSSSLIAVQPASGNPVEATVTSTSKITRAGATVPLASLIPGEAVVVTFAAGPGGTLVVTQLQDIISLPTNTPSPTFTPQPTFTPTPTSEPSPTPTAPGPPSTPP